MIEGILVNLGVQTVVLVLLLFAGEPVISVDCSVDGAYAQATEIAREAERKEPGKKVGVKCEEPTPTMTTDVTGNVTNAP